MKIRLLAKATNPLESIREYPFDRVRNSIKTRSREKEEGRMINVMIIWKRARKL